MSEWPSYRRAVHELDRQFWPEYAPPGLLAVLGVDRQNREQWFLHDVERGLIIENDPPSPGELTDLQGAAMKKIITRLPRPEDWVEWVTILGMGVRVTPTRGANWRPDREILPDSSTRRYSEPEVLDLDAKERCHHDGVAGAHRGASADMPAIFVWGLILTDPHEGLCSDG